jgi:hypothetical protein
MKQKEAVYQATLTVATKYGLEGSIGQVSAQGLLGDRKEEVYAELELMFKSGSVSLKEPKEDEALSKYIRALVSNHWTKDKRLSPVKA